MEGPVVVIVEFLDGGQGRVVLDSSADAGAAGGGATVVIVIIGQLIGGCLFLVTVIKKHLGCGMEEESEEARMMASQARVVRG